MRRLPSAPALLSRILCFGVLVGATFPSRAADALAKEPSALLQTQVASPIEWMPWGEAAFAKAKAEQKPVFVAVGVLTSELARAMARQTFSNADAAALVNEAFVPVYVDAKERPDVAALYQNYLQAVKQLSGPPMNIWLTPELRPFEGANYLPPTEEWGKEGFLTASKRVASAWKADPAAQRRKAEDAIATVNDAQPPAATEAVDAEEITRLLNESGALWRGRYDSANGGFGESPKHPEPELLRFLLDHEDTRDMSLETLDTILNSAVRDPLDGGFFRYAVDAEWSLPYFQKQFTDQSRLALALLDAARVTGVARYDEAARDALHYALDRLRLPDGDFAAAEDATAESTTAAYLWTAAEIRELLGDAAAEEFNRIHGVKPEGNISEDAFPGTETQGKNMLHRAVPLPAGGPEQSIAAAAEKLRRQRDQRTDPLRDDGSPSGAHGLMLTAFARGGAELKDQRLADAAKQQAAFIRDRLRAKDGSLLRLAGRSIPASPADYALVIEGLLTHSRLAEDSKSEQLALELLRDVNNRYWDAANGRYFVVSAEAPGAWARLYSPTPGAGEPPSVEPAMLAALSLAKTDDKQVAEQRDTLARTVAAEIKNAADVPRGDQLLALSTAQK